jgi:hypothetical protein
MNKSKKKKEIQGGKEIKERNNYIESEREKIMTTSTTYSHHTGNRMPSIVPWPL